MSFVVQSAIARRVVGARPGASALLRKAILLQMAVRANDDGTGVYTSKLKIAVWLETEERTVRRAVASLEQDGLLIDTGEHINPNGAVTRDYTICLDALALLPLSEDAFVAKRKVERKRKKQGAGKASAPLKADKAPAPGADTMTGTPDKAPADNIPKDSLPSKEERESIPVGFKLTPSAKDPRAPTHTTGRRIPKAGEATATRAFWTSLRTSGLLHETVKDRCRPKLIDEQLAPILQVYDRDLVAKVVGAYYKRQKKIDGGSRAAALQTICEDGRLVGWIAEAKTMAVSKLEALTCAEAMRRLQASVWRDSWGDRSDPAYDAAREAASGERRAA